MKADILIVSGNTFSRYSLLCRVYSKFIYTGNAHCVCESAKAVPAYKIQIRGTFISIYI